jgi:hypothetical protein
LHTVKFDGSGKAEVEAMQLAKLPGGQFYVEERGD